MPTILVADDMAVIREPLAAALSHAGYHALTASNGVETLGAIQAQRVDLLVLDISMPKVGGIEVLRRLRGSAATAGLPVILLTALGDRRLVVEALRLGVRDYMLKSSFDMERMLGRIRSLLGQDSPGARPAPPEPPEPPEAPQAPKSPAALSPPHPQSAIRNPTSTGAAAEAGAAPAAQPPRAPPRAAPAPKAKAPATPAGAAAMPAAPPPPAAAALKALTPLVTRAQIEAKIAELGELQTLAPTAAKILQLVSSQHTSLDDVVRAIRHDQAISLKILKLANSVVYTRGDPVESVRKAVMRIGLAQIRQAVLNVSIIERFSLTGVGEHFSAPQFWEHSIGCGLLAAEITHGRGGSPEAADRAFTMGLLHDVGRMVYAEQMSDLYRQVVEAADRLQLPLEQVETRLLLVNHADLMDRVLRAWRFPSDLITPIALHHLSIGNIRQVAPSMVDQVATLALANCLAHALLLGSSGNTAVYATHGLANGLKLDPAVIQRAVQTIPDQTQDIKLAMMAAGSGQQQWQPMATTIQEKIGTPIRPLFIGTDPQADAFAIVSDCLRDRVEADAPPNLGVVHIARPAERIEVTKRLTEGENQANVGPLPLVIVSPGGNLALENAAMTDRRVQLLPYPVALTRLVTAVREVLGVAAA